MTATRARDFVEALWPFYKDILRACESPIEKLLAGCLLQRGMEDRMQVQVEAGRYRLDIVVDGWLVVECDGFQWHYEREEQVAADLRRTRWLLSQGYSVIRFTGKEIWNDLERCADEVQAVLSGEDRRRAA